MLCTTQLISKIDIKVLRSTDHGTSLIASSLGHGPSPALASLCVDGFLAFRGQLSKPQINLKMNDEPKPKPPASNIFSILVRPNVPTLVPVVVKNRMCDLRDTLRCCAFILMSKSSRITSGELSQPQFSYNSMLMSKSLRIMFFELS